MDETFWNDVMWASEMTAVSRLLFALTAQQLMQVKVSISFLDLICSMQCWAVCVCKLCSHFPVPVSHQSCAQMS